MDQKPRKAIFGKQLQFCAIHQELADPEIEIYFTVFCFIPLQVRA